MSTVSASRRLRPPNRLAKPFRTFVDEISALVQAMLSPGKIVEEVERMHALQVEADRTQESDPVRAAALRRRAARICIR
jgi:hypothetical protein